MHASEEMLHRLIIVSAARALVDVGDVMAHVPDWQPAVHGLACEHAFSLSVLASNGPHRGPTYQVEDVVVPVVYFLNFSKQ